MEQLEQFRKELNEIDNNLVELLGRRFKIIRAVGDYKKDNNIPMMQSKRVEEVKDRCAKMGQQYNLDNTFVRNIYTVIIDEACRLEDIIIDKESA